ncbi:Sterol desaturase/sphingolipid hydroxylase (Fatty acid hydroxylase superfamily) [Paraburkholderia tropica]|uniref:sterol desaturase family protein n=1 Tax=Paraburkholderia tropica TaxID=92647 RepID=UPI001CB1A515|nr:Sterol desaturase/sphingolipid hydroxylase (Fatty acid hydroxylase superfamily) [Paraburkholderia tropica]
MLHAMGTGMGLDFERFVGLLQTDAYIYIVQPLLFHLHLMDYDEDAYDALYWAVVGVLEIAVTFAILRPLEAWRPIEQWEQRRALWPDVWYTWIAKLGIVNALFFVWLQPTINHLETWMTVKNIWTVNLDEIAPGLTDQPLVSFAIYLVVLDFLGYWYHRWQHRFGIWWELHAVHHSQRQMSLWNDDRNHFVDDIVQTAFFTVVGLFIGVQPGQFVVLVAVSNTLQAIQHVNARLPYGWWLERVIVSPSFHRRHHAMEYGHTGTAYGCNFGVLFPWWDMIFRTASWETAVEPTGITDQLDRPEQRGRNYGKGVWAQQWLALCRIKARMTAASAAAVDSRYERS